MGNALTPAPLPQSEGIKSFSEKEGLSIVVTRNALAYTSAFVLGSQKGFGFLLGCQYLS
jgi:hypothetical protein